LGVLIWQSIKGSSLLFIEWANGYDYIHTQTTKNQSNYTFLAENICIVYVVYGSDAHCKLYEINVNAPKYDLFERTYICSC